MKSAARKAANEKAAVASENFIRKKIGAERTNLAYDSTHEEHVIRCVMIDKS